MLRFLASVAVRKSVYIRQHFARLIFNKRDTLTRYLWPSQARKAMVTLGVFAASAGLFTAIVLLWLDPPRATVVPERRRARRPSYGRVPRAARAVALYRSRRGLLLRGGQAHHLHARLHGGRPRKLLIYMAYWPAQQESNL